MVNRCRGDGDRLASGHPMNPESRSRTRNPLSSAATCALLMLLLVTAMAAILSAGRHSIPLGERIAPRGWSVSFQPPSGWVPLVPDPGYPLLEFVAPDYRRGDRGLRVLNIKNPDRMSADEIAADKGREWGFTLRDNARRRPTKPQIERAPFGPLTGARLEDDERGLIVAVGLHDGRAICVGLVHAQTPLSTRDVELVQSVVDSFEVR